MHVPSLLRPAACVWLLCTPCFADPRSFAKLVPLDDGDPETSEFGFAGESAINTVAFVRSSLQTVGNQQFVTWYGRHESDPDAPYNNTIWIGRRTLGSSRWEVYRHPSFTANNIHDGHDVISFGIDGEGFMHVSWGMHGDDFHYAKSVRPVTGTEAIELGPDSRMTSHETTVTYPQFLRLPEGDLLFLFREGYSGNGDTYLNRYHLDTRSWAPVHGEGDRRAPFIKGMWPSPNYNAYVNMPQLGGKDGRELTLTFSWRYHPVGRDSPAGQDGYQTNNHLHFARSPDAGVSWQRSDGTPYALPLSMHAENGNPATRAEIIVPIPEGSSLINQASTCLDRAGNPVTATWWAPQTAANDFRRQYMVVFRHDDGTWQTRAVSNRTVDPAATRYDERHVRDLGRPVVVTDDDDRIIVLYRDNQDHNGITLVHSLPKAQDPDRLLWHSFVLTDQNLGNYEPIIDNEQWDQHRQLHILYQPSAGMGYTPPANQAAPIAILEWDAARYFAGDTQPSFRLENRNAHFAIASEPHVSYRLSCSVRTGIWDRSKTFPGTGSVIETVHGASENGRRRSWLLERIDS